PTLAEVRLAVPGRGGAVIGGALAASLARAEVEATVLDRFFPRVEAAARPRRGTGLAPREWGLPFAEEPEITRHLAEFLARQRVAAGQADLPLARPDALLFNGGAPTGPSPSRCSRRPTAAASARARSSGRAGSPRCPPSAPSSASGESWSRRRSPSTSRSGSPRSARSRSGAARAPPTIAGASSSASARRS